MKNNKRTNVIPFPNLKERYIDKGMALLKEKNFNEALKMFAEAKNLNEDHAEVYLGMAICQMELGELEEAKTICKKMLLEDIGHYFTVLQIYLTILIQLREYQEVQTTIEAVLEENRLPAESAEHFYKLLEFSRKMNQGDSDGMLEDDLAGDEEIETIYIEDILENPLKQMEYIQSLKDRNIHKHFTALKTLLEYPNSHPVIKSMILHLLLENEVNKEVTINKFGETITVIPANLDDIADLPFTKKVLSILDNILGNENPTLYEAVKELWIRHLYVLYPFLPQPKNTNIWAAALHFVGYEMHGITLEAEEVQQVYDVPLHHLQEACKKIYQIEEISYLQI